jgi:BR-signaling kinase
MQDTLTSKKKGDSAFRQKDFTTAIDCYSQVAFTSQFPLFFKLTCYGSLMLNDVTRILSSVNNTCDRTF